MKIGTLKYSLFTFRTAISHLLMKALISQVLALDISFNPWENVPVESIKKIIHNAIVQDTAGITTNPE
jgi:hypothetical protein